MSRLELRRRYMKRLAATPEERLRIAAAAGDASEVRHILVHHVPDINAADQSGWTALHWAAFCGRAEAAATLIENGANTKARDRGGYTPLDRAGPLRAELEAGWKTHPGTRPRRAKEDD